VLGHGNAHFDLYLPLYGTASVARRRIPNNPEAAS
jgi:hypothetical protein